MNQSESSGLIGRPACSARAGRFFAAPRERRWPGRWLSLVTLCAVFLGCETSFPGKPFSFPTTRVTGTITCGGEPVPRGWVHFQPISATVGDHFIAPLRSDGSFDAEAVPVGKLQVRVIVPDSALEPFKARYGSRLFFARLQKIKMPTSTLTLETAAGAPARFDFDLVTSEVPAE